MKRTMMKRSLTKRLVKKFCCNCSLFESLLSTAVALSRLERELYIVRNIGLFLVIGNSYMYDILL